MTDEEQNALAARVVAAHNARPSVISGSSFAVPLGVVLAGAVAIIGAVWGVAIVFSSFNLQSEILRKEMGDIKRTMWTKQHQRAWAVQAEMKNGGKVIVPDVNSIILQVE